MEGKGNEKLFYYVDKNGTVLQHLGSWNIGGEFHYGGQLATVKAKTGSVYKTYLLDTDGKKYPMTNSLHGLHDGITALDLGRLGLKEIPAVVFEHPQLEILLMGSNNISTIPAAIGQMNNLKMFSVNLNQISVLPSEIWQLTNLKLLDVGCQ
jgi:hypothetical protein